MVHSRQKKSNGRYGDEELALVKYSEDGVLEILKVSELKPGGNGEEIQAPYQDGRYYPAMIIKKSDDKEVLLKLKQMLSKNDSLKRKRQVSEKRKTGSDKQLKGKKRSREDKENKSNEKAKERGVLTSRVDSLLNKMSNACDRFSDGLVQSATDLLSISDDNDDLQLPLTSQRSQTCQSVSTTPVMPTTSSAMHNNRSTLLPPSQPCTPVSHISNSAVQSSSHILTPLSPLQSTGLQSSSLTLPLPPTSSPAFPQTSSALTSPQTPYGPPHASLPKPRRPTTGGKCPRSQPLNQEQVADYCSSCKKLKAENEELRRQIEDLVNNRASVAPRPGKVNELIARRYQMVLLSSVFGVYVYPQHVQEAKQAKSGTACAAYLLNVFYTNEELRGRNLTGANGKEQINDEILESILTFTMSHFSDKKSSLKSSLRNKLQNISIRGRQAEART